MVLASIDYELWRGQAQNGVNLAFQVKFDLEGQGQSPPKTIGTLTKLFCTFCPNLVVLAWTRRDLWRGQARGWQTHTQTDTHTDRQTQATTIPEGQNWPRVKKCLFEDTLNLQRSSPSSHNYIINQPRDQCQCKWLMASTRYWIPGISWPLNTMMLLLRSKEECNDVDFTIYMWCNPWHDSAMINILFSVRYFIIISVTLALL